MQAAVDIVDGESEESLSSKILTKEHLIFPKTLELLCSNKIEIIGQNVKINPD